MKKMTFNKRQSGFGLIEIVLVISIVAVIVVGVIGQFGGANDANKSQEMTKDFTSLVSAIHSLYGQEPNYTGITEVALARSKGLPVKMVDGDEIINPFGGIDLAENAGNARRVDITYEAGTITPAVCSKFISAIAKSAIGITINGAAVTTPALITEQCNANDPDPTGEIVITVD